MILLLPPTTGPHREAVVRRVTPVWSRVRRAAVSATLLLPVLQSAAPAAPAAPLASVQVVRAGGRSQARHAHPRPVQVLKPVVPLSVPGLAKLPPAQLRLTRRPVERTASAYILTPTTQAPAPATGITRRPAALLVARPPRPEHRAAAQLLLPYTLVAPIERLPAARVVAVEPRAPHGGSVLRLIPRANLSADPGIVRPAVARVIHAIDRDRSAPAVVQLSASLAAPDPGITRPATARVVSAKHAAARDRWSVTQLGPVVPLGAVDPGIARQPVARVLPRRPAADIPRLSTLLLPYPLVAPLTRLPAATVVASADPRRREGQVLRLAPRAGLVPPQRLAPIARVVSQPATIARSRAGAVRWVARSDYLGLPTFLHLDFEAVGLPSLRLLAVVRPTITYTADGAPTLRLEDSG